MDLIDPVAISLDWIILHWFAILIAAWLASIAVRAIDTVLWFLDIYR